MRLDPSTPEEMIFRQVTYNVGGLHHKHRLDPIFHMFSASHPHGLEPDLFALQETKARRDVSYKYDAARKRFHVMQRNDRSQGHTSHSHSRGLLNGLTSQHGYNPPAKILDTGNDNILATLVTNAAWAPNRCVIMINIYMAWAQRHRQQTKKPTYAGKGKGRGKRRNKLGLFSFCTYPSVAVTEESA